MVIDPEKRYTATIATSKGSMVIELDPLAAPKTVNNVLTVLSVVLRTAVEWGVIAQVPCSFGQQPDERT